MYEPNKTRHYLRLRAMVLTSDVVAMTEQISALAEALAKTPTVEALDRLSYVRSQLDDARGGVMEFLQQEANNDPHANGAGSAVLSTLYPANDDKEGSPF